jgi:hypothetical protein
MAQQMDGAELNHGEKLIREQRHLEITRDIVIAALTANAVAIPPEPQGAATAIGTLYQKLFALVKGA